MTAKTEVSVEPQTGGDAPGEEGKSLMDRLPALLRLIGGSALLIAMYSFLVKGWQEGNDVFRYLLMLGHTGVLAAVGLASANWLKESKGPRLLLTLSLVSVTVNFAILGALIFSQVGGESLARYPDYVAWTADTLNTALITTAGSMLVLLPVTLLGFAVLARSLSTRLSLLFLAGNAALLLPLRDPQLIGLLVLAMAVTGTVFSRRAFNQNVAARTRDGMLALGLLFMPLAVMIGRTLWLYNVDAFLVTASTFTVFLVLRQLSTCLEKDSSLFNLVGALALIPAVLMAPMLSFTLFDAGFLPEALVIPVASLAGAALVWDIAVRHPSLGSLMRWIAAIVLSTGMVLNQSVFGGVLAAMASLVTGIGVLVLGYQNKLRSAFITGLVLTVAGITQQLYQLIHHFDLGSWLSFAILGVVTIVVASVLDARGRQLTRQLGEWRASFREWD